MRMFRHNNYYYRDFNISSSLQLPMMITATAKWENAVSLHRHHQNNCRKAFIGVQRDLIE